MIILKKVGDIREYLIGKRRSGAKIGFVPTMGALHEGHISLIRNAKSDGGLVICSIFVNPTQFNEKKDFELYPVSTEDDVEMLINVGCDVLFLPPVDEIYPGGTDTEGKFDFGYLETVLEGAFRPGHFQGVGQVVARLLEIVQPDTLYLGQKDYQQCMVIKKLVGMMSMQMTVKICPTMREPDGLAMSSRNRRLTEPQRAIAALIYQCLVSIQSKQDSGDFNIVRKECGDLMTAKGLAPEYIALADAGNLSLLDNYSKAQPMVALIAARVGEVRLIDNILLQ